MQWCPYRKKFGNRKFKVLQIFCCGTIIWNCSTIYSHSFSQTGESVPICTYEKFNLSKTLFLYCLFFRCVTAIKSKNTLLFFPKIVQLLRLNIWCVSKVPLWIKNVGFFFSDEQILSFCFDSPLFWNSGCIKRALFGLLFYSGFHLITLSWNIK